MDKAEARRAAMEVAERYRAIPRNQLTRLLDEQDDFEVAAPSGKAYQVEVNAVWDDRKGGDLRVFVAIDDGGLSAFLPLTVDFIVAPNGDFVDEDGLQ